MSTLSNNSAMGAALDHLKVADKLSRSPSFSFSMWLHSHFHAGHTGPSPTVVFATSIFYFIFFLMKKNVNCCVSPPPATSSQVRVRQKNAGKLCKNNNSVCPAVFDGFWKARATVLADRCCVCGFWITPVLGTCIGVHFHIVSVFLQRFLILVQGIL